MRRDLQSIELHGRAVAPIWKLSEAMIAPAGSYIEHLLKAPHKRKIERPGCGVVKSFYNHNNVINDNNNNIEIIISKEIRSAGDAAGGADKAAGRPGEYWLLFT